MPEPGLRDLLRKIRKNRFTVRGLAAELGLTPGQLDDRLALMERQGFLKLEKPCCQGEGGCACCCCTSRCSHEPAQYTLTDKGRRIAEKGACLFPQSPGAGENSS